MKYRVIHGHVGFDLIDDNPLLVGCSLAPNSIDVGTNTPPTFS